VGACAIPPPQQILWDLGLNGLSLKDYENLFQRSGLEVVRFKVNESKNILLGLFSIFAKVPFLREYFAHNIYTVFQKKIVS
jgi:hypothetical protein